MRASPPEHRKRARAGTRDVAAGLMLAGLTWSALLAAPAFAGMQPADLDPGVVSAKPNMTVAVNTAPVAKKDSAGPATTAAPTPATSAPTTGASASTTTTPATTTVKPTTAATTTKPAAPPTTAANTTKPAVTPTAAATTPKPATTTAATTTKPVTTTTASTTTRPAQTPTAVATAPKPVTTPLKTITVAPKSTGAPAVHPTPVTTPGAKPAHPATGTPMTTPVLPSGTTAAKATGTGTAAVTVGMRPTLTTVTPAPMAHLDDHQTYAYNALGRRDPFQPLIGGQEYLETDAPEDIGGMKVVGIVWGAEDKFALVEDARGNSSVLRRGDKVMNGVVEGLRRDAIIINLTVDGQSQSVTIPLTRKGDSNGNK